MSALRKSKRWIVLAAIATSTVISYTYSTFQSTAVDLTKQQLEDLLTISTGPHVGASWTDGDGSDNPIAVFGTASHPILIDDTMIVDQRTGVIQVGDTEGSTFNLALLKLPHGSEFGFLGVARGPTIKHDFLVVNGFRAREQSLVAFGMNLTSAGQLQVVTPTHKLDIPMVPREGCLWTGQWAATYGPEDPRLFWTDAGTPALTYGGFADETENCRTVIFVSDMRHIYAPLAQALKGKIAPPTIQPGDSIHKSLHRAVGHGRNEKNWVAFYPGSTPNPLGVVPHIHYSFAPMRRLEPAFTTPRLVEYHDIIDIDKSREHCVAKAHPEFGWNPIHQATPMYRLTLCARGCLATDHNTILITVGHMKLKPRYAKYFVAFNSTPPYDAISVGPLFSLAGLDDAKHINYALTLAPIQDADMAATSKPIATPVKYLDNHFFIDDDVLLTMGHDDDAMYSTMFPVRDAIGRMKLCSEIPA